jgi:GTPase
MKQPSPVTYVGKGKVNELKGVCEDQNCDLVIFDEYLSPGQQRNLEDATERHIMDRTALILDIFSQRAHTREGRLQVELAQYEYFLPRLTRLWTHLSRQAVGGVGLRGPGETQLESDRRRIRKRIADLRHELEEVHTHRELYRERRHRADMQVVALVGYTNVGKSTLLNALSGADVLVENKLFATLDPTTRRVDLPGRQAVLVTDTVGLIQKLPTQLVAAFRATLEELTDADLLVHVVDITHKNAPEQVQTVQRLLSELGVGETPTILALNKVDLLLGDESSLPKDGQQLSDFAGLQDVVASLAPPSTDVAFDTVAISAARVWGIESLLRKIEEVLARAWQDVSLRLPYSAGDVAAMVHQRGIVKSESYQAEGIVMEARLPRRFTAQLQQYIVRTT